MRIPSGAEGLRFDYRAGQVGHNVVTAATFRRNCFVQEMGAATCYTLRRNTASIMKI